MADAVEARLRHAQAERLAPLDLVAMLVTDELVRRQDRLLTRRRTQARLRDADKTLDTFDFDFNKKLNQACAAPPQRPPAPVGCGAILA